MRQTNSKSLPKNINYIQHTLNLSKTKTAFSFDKSQRFSNPKTHSPNKFYNIP